MKLYPIGSLVFAKKASGVCEMGSLGVITGHYDRSGFEGAKEQLDTMGADVYFFDTQRQDGFSQKEQESFLMPAVLADHITTVQSCMLMQMEHFWQNLSLNSIPLDNKIYQAALNKYDSIAKLSGDQKLSESALPMVRVSPDQCLKSLLSMFSFAKSEKLWISEPLADALLEPVRAKVRI